MKIYIATLMLIGATATASCDRSLDLANKYDNSNSSKVPDANNEYDPDSFTNFGYVKMGELKLVVPELSIDRHGYIPDGKISTGKYGDSDKYVTYIGAPASLRIVSDSPDIEDYINSATVDNRVFGKGIASTEGFDDGGAWFTGVHQLADGRLAAFYHAESHWAGIPGGHAYKSVGVTYSSDNGITWGVGQKIIASEFAKSTNPEWSGLGDCCVVYNSKLKMYICYYSGKTAKNNYFISMAASADIDGAPGSWKKWDGENFATEACDADTQLGGVNIAVEGLSANAGANPTVMWNSYLNKWIIAYHSWDKSIHMAISDDGLNWKESKCVISSVDELAMYPNFVGESGDLEGGQIINMYYSSNMGENGKRNIGVRKLIFN